ncbi:hypothetical protein DFH08DRAFT_745755 [Mycena albidolilacea]|uniref:Uncharacterized protein n=1 Tax=Mycena albidolilacea TaxID=1033008 RepID=A0AAD7A0J4_9AGAR|nr:hypothetical protein DFH08DRAFT_745755 [Mycena albidolilacea]
MNSQALVSDPLLRLAMQVSLTHREGDRLFEEGRFSTAKALYLQEARKIVGPTYVIPATPGQGEGGVKSDLYINLHPFKFANLVGCCVGMAKCLRHDNDIEMALAWCEEINSLYRCGYHTAPHPLYDWKDFIMDIPPLTLNRSSGLCLASEILMSLGNSGTAVTRRWTATTGTVNLPETHQTPELKSVLNIDLMRRQFELRHPDPQATPNRAVTVPALQLRGSWKRLQIRTPGGVTEGRQNFSSCMWNSQIYIAGGRQTSLGPWYRDLWVLDLAKLDAWRKLPDYPIPHERSGMFLGWNMLVHRDTIILFTGRPTVDTFDLRSETWGSFQTTYSSTTADVQAGVIDSWPYPGRILADATMQILNNKLYVFGGHHRTTTMGSNLFMELDLGTRKWRRLSGTVRVTEHGDYSCPGPRKSASSWVSEDKTRIYMVFGSFDREAAKPGEFHGSDEAYGYGDFWSWDVKKEMWRQERMSGNPPCARTEVACAYNEKLRKTIIFGGYHPSLSTLVLTPGQEVMFPYSFFADTFIYDHGTPPATTRSEPTLSAPKWKQVLTPGFPTYRCQAHLLCDPITGRTYMFGGWTNSQFVPTKSKLISRSFGDLWELRMDMDGGHFEEIDIEEEVRVAKAGPWQRCFACASAGPWKKCGGSCKGRVFFCGAACLREGWKEHKQLHQCRKA